MNRIIYLSLFLDVFGCLIAQPNLRQVNPRSFPFQASDAHIFDDGSAYLVSRLAPYLVKEKNIRQPDTTGNLVIENLNGVRMDHIFCYDKSICYAISSGSLGQALRLYVSRDSARTWSADPLYHPHEIHFVNSGFWIGVHNGVKVSTDQGQTWQNLGNSGLNYSFDDGQSAYFVSDVNHGVYKVSPSGITPHLQTNHITSLTGAVNGFFYLQNGSALISDSGQIYIGDSSLSGHSLLYDLNEPILYSQKSGDTVFCLSHSNLVITTDGGLNWQKISMPPFLRYYYLLGFYDNKLYFEGVGHGEIQVFDYSNSQLLITEGNQHPNTYKLYDLRNGTYYAPSNNIKPDSVLFAYRIGADGKMEDKLHNPGFYFDPAIDFHDSLHGVGCQPWTTEFWTTSDGGASWQKTDIKALLGAQNLNIHSVDYSRDGNCIFVQVDTGYGYRKLQIRLDTSLTITDVRITSNRSTDFWDCNQGYGMGGRLNFTSLGSNRHSFDFGGGSTVTWRETKDFLAVLNTQRLKVGKTWFDFTQMQPHQSYYHLYHFPDGPVFITDSLEVMYFNPNDHKLYYSTDYCYSFSSISLEVGEISEIRQIDATTIMLVGDGGQVHLLEQFDPVKVSSHFAHRTPEITQSLYPNPAETEVNFEFLSYEPKEITIYTMDGHAILKETHHGLKISINIERLERAIYIIQITTDLESDRFKFIKL